MPEDFPILVEQCSVTDCGAMDNILFMFWTRETGPVLYCPVHRRKFIQYAIHFNN